MSAQILASVGVAVALIAAAGGAWFGYRWADGNCRAEQARIATDQARYAAMWRDRHYDLSSAFEAFKTERARSKVEVRHEVERIVERPVYARDCFDADGLRVLNAARGVPAATGEPDASVPGPSDGDRRGGGGPAAANGRGR